jgi:hypothetical protein
VLVPQRYVQIYGPVREALGLAREPEAAIFNYYSGLSASIFFHRDMHSLRYHQVRSPEPLLQQPRAPEPRAPSLFYQPWALRSPEPSRSQSTLLHTMTSGAHEEQALHFAACKAMSKEAPDRSRLVLPQTVRRRGSTVPRACGTLSRPRSCGALSWSRSCAELAVAPPSAQAVADSVLVITRFLNVRQHGVDARELAKVAATIGQDGIDQRERTAEGAWQHKWSQMGESMRAAGKGAEFERVATKVEKNKDLVDFGKGRNTCGSFGALAAVR